MDDQNVQPTPENSERPSLVQTLKAWTIELQQHRPEVSAATRSFVRVGSRFAYKLFYGLADDVRAGFAEGQEELEAIKAIRAKRITPLK